MIRLFPEPKFIKDCEGKTKSFTGLTFKTADAGIGIDELLKIAQFRFWNCKDVAISAEEAEGFLQVTTDNDIDCASVPEEQKTLFENQGYQLLIEEDKVKLSYMGREGLVNGLTSLKQLIEDKNGSFCLPLCSITDWPALAVRAVAPTFSWYAGYGRIGFDSQLWGYDEWAEFLNVCLDNKINQFNMVMYGYWPFDNPGYPETVFRDIPIKIWNAENRKWLTVHYTHPNLEEPYLDRFIEFAHLFGVKIFAYVGLNSYNGAYSIKHPEARTKAPDTGKFLNDFDSLCLSYPGTVDYILNSMRQIARLGFDGYTLEESEEGFWYCECEQCKKTWHASASSPVEAKHNANMWLLNQIYKAVREVNPDCVIGIRAFRQPPLEKDPAFLKKCVESMPEDIMLFWAPGLYVPKTEFPKWADAFGKDHIWARDTEANSITSTMGRLYRTFKSNMIRYEDEGNEQVIETDINQHRGSVEIGAHGINGFMFEWFGLFLFLFAHGNYGWGGTMNEDEFFKEVCTFNFGEELGEKVLYVMRNMLTIHESQMNLYSTPFPFQKNKIREDDIPAIEKAIENHPKILETIDQCREACYREGRLHPWLTHFDKLYNAERRNRVIYDMILTSLQYDKETDPVKKDALLDEILYYNEKDFDIVKEMFFDINPVEETGVRSCMYPYHEIKRLINNIRHPENPDDRIICSGIEALGWLWL